MRRIILATALLPLAAFSSAQIVSVNVDTAGNTWTYVVSYSFEEGQWTSLRSFHLPLSGPVSNIRIEGDDHGWTYETDNATYVRWYNPDPDPVPDDIFTGEFMVFLFDSPYVDSKEVTASITTWDPWVGAEGGTLTPTTVSPVPEPATAVVLGLGALAALRKRRSRQAERRFE